MASSRAIEAAKAFVRIYADDSALRKTLGGLRGQLQKTSEAFSGIATTATIAGIGAGAAGMLMVSANAERSAVAFEVMLGSATAAKTMLDEIYKLGKESSFGANDFIQAGQVLLNFGASADAVLPTLRMLGDIAAGDSEKLQRMTVVYGQMSAAGRLMGQDLLQMINAGFNPLQQISQKTGESMIELKKRMEAGGISSGEVAEAFKAATSEGGRFYGMTNRISKTTIGVWMTLKDEIMMLAKDMGGHLMPALNWTLTAIRYIVSGFSGWGKALVSVGAALGTFLIAIKAITVAKLAYAKASAVAQAFSSPKGWMILAGATAAAAAAVAAIDLTTGDMAAQAEAAHKPLDVMAKDVVKLGNAGQTAAEQLKEMENAAKDAQKTIDRMQSPVKQARAAVQEFADALAVGGKWGMIYDGNPLVEAFREQESGYVDSLKKIQNEIAVLSGVATEAGIEMQHMMDVGVDPAKVEQLRQLTAQRDDMIKQKEKKKENEEFWKDKRREMEDAAEDVRRSIETVKQTFARERAQMQTLVTNGVLSQADADAALRKNPKFAAIMDGANPDGIRDSMRANSSPAQDLRSVSGASQLTALINGQGTVQDRQLSMLTQVNLKMGRLVTIVERDPEVHKI